MNKTEEQKPLTKEELLELDKKRKERRASLRAAIDDLKVEVEFKEFQARYNKATYEYHLYGMKLDELYANTMGQSAVPPQQEPTPEASKEEEAAKDKEIREQLSGDIIPQGNTE